MIGMSYGRIPDEVVEAVLRQNDIVDVVGKYVHLAKQGHYLKGLCPFHSEKTPSFTVTPEKQIYYCYGCHAGGNSIHFVMEIEGYSFPEAVRHMAEESGIAVEWEEPDEEKTQERKDREALYLAYEFAAKWYHHVLLNTEEGRPALTYLRNRGLSDRWIEEFQIGYAPTHWDLLTQVLNKRNHPLPLLQKGGLISGKQDGSGYIDKFRDRVIFPIRDFKGRVIAFAGRALGDVEPKYLNSPESMIFNKSRSLFNIHQARPEIRKKRQAVLFEGYMDTVKAWEAGVRNGVATMGTALTEDHAEVLRRNSEEVIVCYDGDKAGQNAAYKSLAILDKAGLTAKVAVLPQGMDPDEFIGAHGPHKFVREIIEGALTSVRYKLHYSRQNFNLQKEDGLIGYVGTAVKIIAELSSPVEREHYAQELANEFSYSFDTIRQQLNEYRQELLKKREFRDKKEKSWNNGMNNGNGRKTPTALEPAYQKAEVKLLAIMMHDREVAEYVREQLGDQFNVETHAALAAYLYAFYAQGNVPDVSRYLATLQDERLESAAGSILMTDANQGANERVIDDYIREIHKYPQMMAIKHKKEEMIRAERSGDIGQAAQIASEIITLEKQLKSF